MTHFLLVLLAIVFINFTLAFTLLRVHIHIQWQMIEIAVDMCHISSLKTPPSNESQPLINATCKHTSARKKCHASIKHQVALVLVYVV